MKKYSNKKKKILFHFFCFCCCLCFGLCVYTEYVCSNHKTFEIFLVHSILIPHRKAPNRPSSLYMCVELEWNNNDDVDDDYECRKKNFYFFLFLLHIQNGKILYVFIFLYVCNLIIIVWQPHFT